MSGRDDAGRDQGSTPRFARARIRDALFHYFFNLFQLLVVRRIQAMHIGHDNIAYGPLGAADAPEVGNIGTVVGRLDLTPGEGLKL